MHTFSVLQVEAGFRNHIHRSVHRAHKETPADAAVKASAAGVSTDSNLAVKADNITDEDKGNYSDIFVCHGTLLSV
jgi:hypothetical protein